MVMYNINATTRLMFELEVEAVNLCEINLEKPSKTNYMYQHSSTPAPQHSYITYLIMTLSCKN